jgi:tape measure domain-containing protein
MGAVIEDTLSTRLGWIGLASFLQGTESIARGFGLIDKSMTATQRKALSSAAAYGAAGAGLGAFLIRAGVEAGKLDRLENSLSIVTGSSKAARQQMDALQGTSASQLFGTDATARAALNIRNMGGDLDFARLAVTAMANATSAAGGDQTDFLAGTEAVSRALQTEHLGMRDLRAIMRASGPAFKLLADSMGVTVSQLEQMEFKGETAKQKLRELLEAENRVHGNAADSDLNTLPGQMARLQHRAEDAGRAVGRSVEAPLRSAVKWAADLVDLFDRMPGEVHQGAAVGGGGLAALLGIRAAGGLAGFLGRLPAFAGVAARVAPFLGAARAATPYGLVAAAGDYASGFVQNPRARGALQGGFTGLGVGAALGTLAGGRTVPGALLGTLVGALLGTIASGKTGNVVSSGGKAGVSASPELTALQKIEQHLSQMRSDVATMVRGDVFNTTDTPGAFQALAAARIGGMMR